MSTIPSDSLVPAELPARFVARALDAALLVAATVGLGLLMGFGYDWLLLNATIVFGYFALLDTLALQTGRRPETHRRRARRKNRQRR